MMPVRLSVTEVHWRIIANLGFKFRSHFTVHWREMIRPQAARRPPAARRALAAVLLAGESSRAMLASAGFVEDFTCSYNGPCDSNHSMTLPQQPHCNVVHGLALLLCVICLVVVLS